MFKRRKKNKNDDKRQEICEKYFNGDAFHEPPSTGSDVIKPAALVFCNYTCRLTQEIIIVL